MNKIITKDKKFEEYNTAWQNCKIRGKGEAKIVRIHIF
jgi:hypothetical protein